ncbi:MAG: hypothetical protein SGARI_000999 [Bacillariaceae sp.]
MSQPAALDDLIKSVNGNTKKLLKFGAMDMETLKEQAPVYEAAAENAKKAYHEAQQATARARAELDATNSSIANVRDKHERDVRAAERARDAELLPLYEAQIKLKDQQIAKLQEEIAKLRAEKQESESNGDSDSDEHIHKKPRTTE